MDRIVDKSTQMEAKSLSFPNLTAIITLPVALGIASRKKVVYFIVDGMGR